MQHRHAQCEAVMSNQPRAVLKALPQTSIGSVSRSWSPDGVVSAGEGSSGPTQSCATSTCCALYRAAGSRAGQMSAAGGANAPALATMRSSAGAATALQRARDLPTHGLRCDRDR